MTASSRRGPGSAAPRRLAIACRRVAGVTGTTTTILEHARRFSRLGWEVHVYGERLDAARLRAAGARAHRIPGWPWGSYPKRRLFAWLFARAARAQAFDLICGHGDTLDQDVLSLHNCVHAAHEAVHGRPLPKSSGVGRLHARMLGERSFRLLVANSELMKRDVVSRFGVPPDAVTVIHPGHDPERFRRQDRGRLGADLRAQLGAAAGDVVVGLITSGDFEKRGVGLFLRSLGRLGPQERRRLRVVVAGQETRLGPYRALAAEVLGDRVAFIKPRPDVERLYHALDMYVHPALFEEFGQSVQEAMACGVPALATARVGAAELLTGEARETLLDKPEEGALAGAVSRLIADPEKRRRWAEDGARACAGNTWDRNFQAHLESYESLVPRRDRSAADAATGAGAPSRT